MRKQLHNTCGDQPAQRRRFSPLAPIGVLTSVVLTLIAGAVFVLPHLRSHAAPSLPYLERQELITDKCAVSPEGCGWSANKSRIVRTSDDTVYAAYVAEGDGTFQGKIWHLMQRQTDGTWKEIGSGPAGSEPVSLLRAPDDSLYVVAFPQNDSLHVIHFTKTSSGSFTSTDTLVPGFGTNPWDATYSGAGINTQGNIVITQTSWNKPNDRSHFARDIYWTYYNPTTNQWTNHDTPLDYSHRYLFVFPGEHNDLSFVGQRDEQRTVLGFSPNSTYGQPPCQSWALINEVKYFHTDNVDTQPVSNLLIKEEYPQSCEFLIHQVNDAYIDTQGRMHILYMDQQNGGVHHAIVQNGAVVKDVLLSIPNIWFGRIIQDTTGRFYVITASDNIMYVYPGSAGDTDGTQLDPPVDLTLTRSASVTNGGQPQNPFLAMPRGGTPLADYVDGIYLSGSANEYVYFRLRLRASGSGSDPTPTSPAQVTPTSVPQVTPTPTSVPQSTPAPTPLSGQSYSIYNGRLAPGWKQGAYQSRVNLTNPTPSFDGKPSIAWTANSGWATFVLANSSLVDTTPYGYLHFALQAGQANEHYAVQVYDISGRGLSSYVLLSNYGGDPVPGQWKVYNIPLAALGAVGKQINGITLQNFSSNAHQVLYLDDISFQ